MKTMPPMPSGTVLHLFGWDRKFFLPFRDLIHEHFADGMHQFIVYGDVTVDDVPASPDTSVKPSIIKNIVGMTMAMNKAEKIILHGLFYSHLLYLLAMQPWLLKKCYWVIWGGDLYFHEAPVKDWRGKRNALIRHFVFKRIGYLVSGTAGDVELAREWYGAMGAHIRCFNYPSNIYKEYTVPEINHLGTNLQVGNSADPSNNHLEVFDRLEAYKEQDIKIYAPLSYGNKTYALKVIEEGKKRFGEKFVPLAEMMPFDQYLEYLRGIDVAIFNHRRQQAFGNTITLLGLGKKVYLNSKSTLNGVFEDFNIKIFDIDNLNIEKLDEKIKRENIEKIKVEFSEESLVQSLKKWIE